MLPLAIVENPLTLIVVLFIAILLFGNKLPSVARSLGSSVSEFKKGMREGESDLNQPPLPASQPTPPDTQQSSAFTPNQGSERS